MTKTKPWEVFHVFLRLGLTSFGGPIAHLGYFRNELVSRRRWISEEHYGQLVGLCQFLPGPASSQVGFALGFIRGGYLGAVAAWTAFTLPSALLLVLFAIGAVNLDGAIAEGLVIGLKAVAVAVVAHAVWGMAKSLTPDLRRILIGIVAVALVLILPSNIGQIGAIVAGIIAGVIWCRHLVQTQPAPLSVEISKYVGIISVVLFAVLLFGLPIITALWDDPWVSLTDAFYRAGALVFGGGHVVLPLLQAEPAVTEAVSQDQFLAGYGAAQAVPGPLFTFAAFLGFEMGSGGSAWLSAALALVSVFLPGILLLLATLPFWSKIQQNQVARSAVLGANAAVVGIMTAALITPIITEGITGYATLIIAVGCFALLLFAKVPAWSVVLIGGLVGVVASVTDVGLTWV
ncbi:MULTISPECIES: chromate efflux transporter [Auritidibacter]|uniref:chromate efflux transporter n=1 Tax=Auritidibacter TaxID=1160973 RepID=UPI000D72650F|nr:MULTISPECIES: chromate efflux transporter [Auritidibacter]PXA78119.1 chromate transporter [Auritidibacter sp. NML120779]AXR73595.1 chromate efflux transporter [Auritidibacter sp. NML130574]NIH70575.1 chromate transporter [Auritidibacter ignavus]PXA81481.1 chromate transporter [Auritidibacter sp. NML120636]RMX22598.1 chromate efflux transporter [Auritidibacter ignavus]